MVYYNTNKETGKTLVNSQQKAQTQEQKVHDYFLATGKTMSPSHVLKAVFNNNTPITSVRRAITNLTDSGSLFKTDTMVIGLYGKQEHTWKYKTPIKDTLFDMGD